MKTAIQVKRHTTGSIGAPTVRELRGGLGPHDRGLIITLSTFSKDARREASEPDRSPISLVDGAALIELLIDSRVGVSSTNVTILELDEGFFTEGADDDTAEQLAAADTPTPVRRVRSLTRPGKVLSLWPLPGGGGAWKDTLDAMLKHIAAEAPTMADAISWLTSSFDRVASQKTSRGYWQVLRSFGLIETQGEQVSVTAVGTEYLEDPTNTRLLEIAKARVVGIEEMLGWLSDQPMTMKELLTRFRDELGVEWQSTAQIQFRLGWLTVLGAALDDEGRWRTTRPNGAQD